MAMTKAQIDAEIARKAATGEKATNPANQAKIDALRAAQQAATKTTTSTTTAKPAASATPAKTGTTGAVGGGTSSQTKPAATTSSTPSNTVLAQNPGYATSQQARYSQAIASGDKDLQKKLELDAARVGYSLTGSSQGGQSGTQSNGGTANDTYFDRVYGGKDKYVADQNARYTQAIASGDAELKRKIELDAARVGYSLNTNFSGAGDQPSTGGGTSSPTPITPTPTTPTTPTQPNGNDMARQYIEKLAEERRKAQIAALEKAKQEALSNLQGEKAKIQPMFYDQRNQAAAQSQQQARNFAEFLAARGGTSSGAGAQAEISRNMNLQSNLGALGRQETAALSEIARRETDVNNAFQQDVAATEAGLQAERVNLLLDDYYRAQERGDRLTQLAIENEFQRAGLTGYLNGQRTLAGQGLDLEREFGYADRTGYLGGQRTLAGQSYDRGVYEDNRNFQYQQGRDRVADNQWNQQRDFQQAQFDFQKGQQEWENMFRQQQFSEDRAARLWEQTFREKSFAQEVREAAASRGLQWASLGQRQKEFIAQEAWNRKQFDAEQGWKQKEWDWMTSPNNPDNMPQMPKITTEELESEYVSNLGKLDDASLKTFFANEEANIVKDLGIAGYNRLYSRYFDEDGLRKK